MKLLKRTPLYPIYEEHGARVIDFGGWEMPVQFSGIIEEHNAVRTAAGLFDVSHMGEIEIHGPGALPLVQRLITNNARVAPDYRALYALMCRPDGGIVDDLLVYRFSEERFLLVVNAANTEKALTHIQAVAQSRTGEPGPGAVQVTDRTADYAVLALQGPSAPGILSRLFDGADHQSPVHLRPFRFATDVSLAGYTVPIVSRTGYTGEDGFELFIRPEDAIPIWRAIIAAGREDGLKPVGLGARDTLRFEACLPLYGNELTEDINPLEAGLGTFVKLDKDEPFIGQEALQAVAEQGPRRRLVGLELLDRGIARHGYVVLDEGGQAVGHVTSGAMSPTLQKSLALAYVPAGMAVVGNQVLIDIRGQQRRARIVETPFYRRRG